MNIFFFRQDELKRPQGTPPILLNYIKSCNDHTSKLACLRNDQHTPVATDSLIDELEDLLPG